ncbi:Peptide deformylase [Dirofilaria immitis]
MNALDEFSTRKRNFAGGGRHMILWSDTIWRRSFVSKRRKRGGEGIWSNIMAKQVGLSIVVTIIRKGDRSWLDLPRTASEKIYRPTVIWRNRLKRCEEGCWSRRRRGQKICRTECVTSI